MIIKMITILLDPLNWARWHNLHLSLHGSMLAFPEHNFKITIRTVFRIIINVIVFSKFFLAIYWFLQVGWFLYKISCFQFIWSSSHCYYFTFKLQTCAMVSFIFNINSLLISQWRVCVNIHYLLMKPAFHKPEFRILAFGDKFVQVEQRTLECLIVREGCCDCNSNILLVKIV